MGCLHKGKIPYPRSWGVNGRELGCLLAGQGVFPGTYSTGIFLSPSSIIFIFPLWPSPFFFFFPKILFLHAHVHPVSPLSLLLLFPSLSPSSSSSPTPQAGKIPPNSTVGRLLMEMVSRVPKIEGPKFDSMLNATM